MVFGLRGGRRRPKAVARVVGRRRPALSLLCCPRSPLQTALPACTQVLLRPLRTHTPTERADDDHTTPHTKPTPPSSFIVTRARARRTNRHARPPAAARSCGRTTSSSSSTARPRQQQQEHKQQEEERPAAIARRRRRRLGRVGSVVVGSGPPAANAPAPCSSSPARPAARLDVPRADGVAPSPGAERVAGALEIKRFSRRASRRPQGAPLTAAPSPPEKKTHEKHPP